MSARNNQTSKAAARERLREERAREARKAKVRRQGIVVASGVAVLAIAGVASYGIAQSNKPSHWASVAKVTNIVAPKNTSGTDGTTVIVGKSTAKKTLVEYEDPRCPICQQFENANGATVIQDVNAGQYKVQYVGATFIDNNDSGTGSKTALSALGAALNVSPQAFLDYKHQMYSPKWHPDETKDTFSKKSYLIEIANTVPELKNNKSFQNNVNKGTFDAWALKMSAKFDASGVQGTPTFKVDGKALTVPGSSNPPLTQADFNSVIVPAVKA